MTETRQVMTGPRAGNMMGDHWYRSDTRNLQETTGTMYVYTRADNAKILVFLVWSVHHLITETPNCEIVLLPMFTLLSILSKGFHIKN